MLKDGREEKLKICKMWGRGRDGKRRPGACQKRLFVLFILEIFNGPSDNEKNVFTFFNLGSNRLVLRKRSLEWLMTFPTWDAEAAFSKLCSADCERDEKHPSSIFVPRRRAGERRRNLQ